MTHHTGSDEGRVEVTVAIKAQNPDLETAWRTIAWWEQTCNYWREQATAARAAAPDALRERVERVEALLELWESWDGTRPHPGESSPRQREQLRAALAERPTDGAGT